MSEANTPWVWWEEECKLCKDEGCKYMEKVIKFKDELSSLGKSHKGIYGTLKFNCDYFVYDASKDNKEDKTCCPG